jgi:transposase
MAFTSGFVVRDVANRQERSHSMESFAGADLHKRVTQLAVLRDGQPPSQFRFPNDPKTVHGVLRKLPRGTKIAVEATGSWWWFVEKARELGHEVCLSHPKQTKAIAHARLKSDKKVGQSGCGDVSATA